MVLPKSQYMGPVVRQQFGRQRSDQIHLERRLGAEDRYGLQLPVVASPNSPMLAISAGHRPTAFGAMARTRPLSGRGRSRGRHRRPG